MLEVEIEEFYARGDEDARLVSDGRARLELVRTLELLDRFLPPAPARVLDVGGGTGVYAVELCNRGYDVVMIDPVQSHVDRARMVIEERGLGRSMTAEVGDTRQLGSADGSFDSVLMFGPLYHLTSSTDRQRAWSEAVRVARSGAAVIAVGVSRFASLLDGLKRGVLADPVFRRVVEADLADGQHRNPEGSGRVEFFTTAYFHTPDALFSEAAIAGLEDAQIFAVEGPAWMVENIDDIDSQVFSARAIESEPSLLGASSHMMLVGTTPGQDQ